MSGVASTRVLHLLDANVLVDAARDYYPFTQVPEFWDWLLDAGSRDMVKIPDEIYEEITMGNDDLAKWLKGKRVKSQLYLEEEPDLELVRRVVERGYAADLNEDEVERLGRDPILVAYALADGGRCVVTGETSQASKQRANRKVPNVCDSMGVPWKPKFALTKDLGFATNWKARRPK